MTSLAVSVAPWCLLVLTAAMVLAFVRVARGPGAADRLVAVDLVAVLAAGAMVLLAVQEDAPLYVRVALVIALVSFLGTVALAFYVQQSGRPRD